MQTASSEMESKSVNTSICVYHYTLRAPCPKGQGNGGTIQIRVYKIGPVIFEYEYIRLQCVLVTRESSTREYGSRVFHSSLCRPLLFILS